MNNTDQKLRINMLREELSTHNLAAFLVPREDEYQNYDVPPCSERLAWISGFRGSAGLAVIGRQKAALFVDGRYTVQAKMEAISLFWEHHHIIDSPPAAWIVDQFVAGDRVGYDPRLHTPNGLECIQTAVKRIGAIMVPLKSNLIDRVWVDRPAPPMSPVTIYPELLSGKSSESKRYAISEILRQEKLDALVITAPDSLAWLFNIRGSDLEMTPFALGFGILKADETASLYIDNVKLSADTREKLEIQGKGSITIFDLEIFESTLASSLPNCKVRVDYMTGNIQIVDQLRRAGAIVDIGDDPCTLVKACKTESELNGIRAAHARDGIAIVHFLKWFIDKASGNETEWTAACKLDNLRVSGENYRSQSFKTISATGSNSAICHYKVDKQTALPIKDNEIYLFDSGGQYLDGTTDVTRTLIVGTPTSEMKRRYTQILKGHIAIATARFPAGTTGSQIDVLARQYLWQDGVDFDHGTGHGVGCYLSVHEGPHSISKKPSKIKLQPGMIVSNEPGYYKAGEFGIRIENLLIVTELDPQPKGAEITILGFETITLVPYEHCLIEVSLLSNAEQTWINSYHDRVYKALAPNLSFEDETFLKAATRPLE
jgi:Xaa-Pro aminopeptidase